MKNLFTFNETTQEEVYKKFLLREGEKALMERSEKMMAQQKQLEKKATLPNWVSILQMMVISFSCMILIAILADIVELIQEGRDWLDFLDANTLVRQMSTYAHSAKVR